MSFLYILFFIFNLLHIDIYHNFLCYNIIYSIFLMSISIFVYYSSTFFYIYVNHPFPHLAQIPFSSAPLPPLPPLSRFLSSCLSSIPVPLHLLSALHIFTSLLSSFSYSSSSSSSSSSFSSLLLYLPAWCCVPLNLFSLMLNSYTPMRLNPNFTSTMKMKPRKSGR